MGRPSGSTGCGGTATGCDAEADAAAVELNWLLRAHRAAAADPSARDVAAAGANVVRIGYGSGEQVADGRFTEAYELPPEDDSSKPRRRAAALAPDERLAAILGGRDELLACEELVLRARSDIEAGRPREAALQARIALEALLAELGDGDAAARSRRRGPRRERGPVRRSAGRARGCRGRRGRAHGDRSPPAPPWSHNGQLIPNLHRPFTPSGQSPSNLRAGRPLVE